MTHPSDDKASQRPLPADSIASDHHRHPSKEIVESGVADPIEYVEGFKLFSIVACVTLACFLNLMDTMVVSTVSMALVTIYRC